MSEKLQKDFLEMLNQCQGIVMKVCLCFTDRQPANIDDLYQDIVSELWTSYPRFRQESKPSTWVYAVALNTALMRHRSRKRMPQFVELTPGMCENIADTGGDKLVERLYQLIGRLDPRDQTLLFLYLDKVSQRDIAQMLHTSEDTINQRVNRLKKKLKKMNEHEP